MACIHVHVNTHSSPYECIVHVNISHDKHHHFSIHLHVHVGLINYYLHVVAKDISYNMSTYITNTYTIVLQEVTYTTKVM